MNNAEKASPKEQSLKELFIGKCWSYLSDNFHKFKQPNQIKIALELCKKDVPQENVGNYNITHMPVIKIDDVPKEYNLGQRASEPS